MLVIFWGIIALLFVSSCNKEKDEQIFNKGTRKIGSEIELVESFAKQQKLAVFKFKTSMYILDYKDSVTYFIQYNDVNKISKLKPTKVKYNKNKNLLISSESNESSTMILDDNIYAIGKLNGLPYERLKKGQLEKRSDDYYFEFTWLEEPEDIYEVKCGCIGLKAKQPTNCKSGGSGSTQCGVTDGWGVATVNWGNHCEVACGAGTYSCCAIENNFEYK